MKRWIAALLCAIMIVSVCGCNVAPELITSMMMKRGSDESTEDEDIIESEEFKVGFLLNGAENSPATASHIKAIRKMQEDTGLKDNQVKIKTKVNKEHCARLVKKMVNAGYKLIISTDPKYQETILAYAKKYPEVQFCQEDGNQAKQSKLSNMHDYYSRIYEGYYIAGIIAGMKLNQLIEEGDATQEDPIGFVASDESAQCISAYTAFLLGVKQAHSTAHMIVRYVGGTGNYKKDKTEAKQLVLAGAKVMSCFTATNAVATVCAEYNIPLVGCEGNMMPVAPGQALTSPMTDWSGYYTTIVNAASQGDAFDTDWCQGYKENVVTLSKLNDSIMTTEMIDEVIKQENKMRNGQTKVFDTANFTVDEQSLEEKLSTKMYKAYAGYVSEGQFHESDKNSAPAFDILIDGIEISKEDLIKEQEEALKALEESTSTEESSTEEGTSEESDE